MNSLRGIRFYIGVAIILLGGVFASGVVSAHELVRDNGYTAVLHIDPDDDPLAGQAAVLNFLISRDGSSYNQNDYYISIAISANGQATDHVLVEPAVFGNATDGIAKYTFPKTKVYTIDLTGQRKSDASDKFRMSFIVRVAGTAAVASSGNGTYVLILGAGGLVILGTAAYSAIVRGKRLHARKP